MGRGRFPTDYNETHFYGPKISNFFLLPSFSHAFFLPEFTDTLGKQRSSALILLCRLATTATEGREDRMIRIALRFSCVKHLLLFPCSLLPRKEDSGAFLFPFLFLRTHRWTVSVIRQGLSGLSGHGDGKMPHWCTYGDIPRLTGGNKEGPSLNMCVCCWKN